MSPRPRDDHVRLALQNGRVRGVHLVKLAPSMASPWTFERAFTAPRCQRHDIFRSQQLDPRSRLLLHILAAYSRSREDSLVAFARRCQERGQPLRASYDWPLSRCGDITASKSAAGWHVSTKENQIDRRACGTREVLWRRRATNMFSLELVHDDRQPEDKSEPPRSCVAHLGFRCMQCGMVR